MNIPPHWIQLEDGSYAPPSALGRVVTGKPMVTASDQRESVLHDSIASHCRSKQWPCVHSRMDKPATVQIGTPDFVIAMPAGRTLWIEAKAKAGKVTNEQRNWLAMLSRVGHEAHIVRSFAEFLEIAK